MVLATGGNGGEGRIQVEARRIRVAAARFRPVAARFRPAEARFRDSQQNREESGWRRRDSGWRRRDSGRRLLAAARACSIQPTNRERERARESARAVGLGLVWRDWARRLFPCPGRIVAVLKPYRLYFLSFLNGKIGHGSDTRIGVSEPYRTRTRLT